MSDEDGSLSRRVTTKAINTIMTERIWIKCAASEMAFQPMYSDTGAPLREERVTTVRKKPNLHLKKEERKKEERKKRRESERERERKGEKGEKGGGGGEEGREGGRKGGRKGEK